MVVPKLFDRLKNKLLLILILSCSFASYSQENEIENKEGFLKNKLSLYTGYSWIPEGRNPDTNKKETIFAPTFGFSYEYWFSEKWAIGTYNDIEIINFQVEQEDSQFLERENAIALSLAATYKLFPKMTVSLGGGVESDSNETLGIVRVGGEYVLLEKNEWELSVSLTLVHKEIYEIVGFGFVLGKKF